MKQLFPRGKRIHPTDKDLVFHTAFAALFPVFLLVVLLFHIQQIVGTNWQEVTLSQITQDINIPYLLFSMGVAGLVCLTVVLLFWRYRRDEVKQLIHRQKLARMVLENKWYESEQRKENAFFKDLSSSRSKETIGVGSYCDYSTYLPECKDIVEQLATMIHEILETSKINMETTQEDSTKCNLSDLILNVCEPYKLIAATHGINLKLDIPQEYRIIIPQKQFSRAFSNIIANAVTYTPNEGSVFVCLKEHTLTVENECIPIDKQQLAHIFEPFYRPDFSRNSDSGGNGLGLYIVSTIFSSLHISYEFLPTESQKGMCFSILLPKAL